MAYICLNKKESFGTYFVDSVLPLHIIIHFFLENTTAENTGLAAHNNEAADARPGADIGAESRVGDQGAGTGYQRINPVRPCLLSLIFDWQNKTEFVH
jgi:hypothetical protein